MEQEAIVEPVEETPVSEQPEALFWLATVEIYYKSGNLNRSRNVNVLVTTQTAYITGGILGKIQQNAQIQAYDQQKIPKNSEISDIVISNISMLGQMTQSIFNSGIPNVEQA